ncbi:NlpC/P60 family protein [Streptomyces sp. NPDC020898]|uniref:NlpC/P60 family protein n=1 Tax=Streptomyces sp. NPDC020898 TaxID=3365101 RepID=UPI0037A4445D
MAPERTPRDDGPSREEVRQRINSLYDQAESATGTFNATRAMKAGMRRRANPAPDSGRRRSDPALDEVARPWFDVARARLGPTMPAMLPPDRRPAPAPSPETRPARPVNPPAELTARPVAELTAGPVPALPAGALPELPPAPVAALPAGPAPALTAVPAPRQEAPAGPNTLSAEPSWFPSPSLGTAPLLATGPLPAEDAWRLPDEQPSLQPAEEWRLPQSAVQGADEPFPMGTPLGADASLGAGTPIYADVPLYAGTLLDGDYALITELPLVAEPFPATEQFPATDPFPAAEPFPVTDPFFVTETSYGTGTYFAPEPPFQGAGTGAVVVPGIAFRAESGAKAEKAVAFARAQIGRPCVWGAAGPGSYDNSGLVQAAWKAAGVALPRAVHEQASAGVAIDLADIRPGDLVFFHGEAGHVGHVGVFVGDGMMMHAPNPGATVREDSILAAGRSAIHSVLRPA